MIGAAALLLAAAPALTAPPQTPVELFKAACTAGRVALPRGTAAQVDYATLPRGAREALGQTLAPPGQSNPAGAARPEDVPGPVLAVGPSEALFLVAPGAEQAQGSFAHACAVIWKGEHFAEGRAAILPADAAQQPAAETPAANSLGLAAVGTHSGGLYLSVTALRGWTVLKAAPEAASQSPGAH